MATFGTNIEVEIICFTNDAFNAESGGLGFGIVGNPSTGVIIKTILPTSTAYKDKRLRAGDRILQVGDMNVQGMSSQQVATILRQLTTDRVELVVGRAPSDHIETDISKTSLRWTMETKKALSPHILKEEVQYRLMSSNSSNSKISNQSKQRHSIITEISRSSIGVIANGSLVNKFQDANAAYDYDVKHFPDFEPPTASTSSAIESKISELYGAKKMSACSAHSSDTDNNQEIKKMNSSQNSSARNSLQSYSKKQRISLRALQELALTTFCRENWIEGKYTIIEVELKRYLRRSLGITVAGYAYQDGSYGQEIGGVFVKSVPSECSAQMEGHKQIRVHDLIIAVNEHSLEHLSHKDSVHLLVTSGSRVRLKIVRFDEDTPQNKCLKMIYENEYLGEQERQITEGHGEKERLEKHKNYWTDCLGLDFEIVAVELKPDNALTEDGGLGISLEGTVDVVNGAQLCPHHFVESLRNDGPAALAGVLKAGDELLQVNDRILYGKSHVTVVQELSLAVDEAKRTDSYIQLFCCRKVEPIKLYSHVNEQNLPLSYSLLAAMHDEHIVKAKSETLLFTQTQTYIEKDYDFLSNSDLDEKFDDNKKNDIEYNNEIKIKDSTSTRSLSPKGWGRITSTRRNRTHMRTTALLKAASRKLRCRSLEHLSSLAIWHCVPIIVTLEKDSKGLGFSVIDYQDPLHSSESVIVVRSLVPGGVAQADGRIVPGDRLLFVNGEDLSHASLDRAVAALKSAQLGPVRLGIAKPVPVDQLLLGEHRPLISRSERLLAQRSSPARRERRNIVLPPRSSSAIAGAVTDEALSSATSSTFINEYLRNRCSFYRHYDSSLKSISGTDALSQEEILIGADNYRKLNPQLYFASSSESVSPSSFRSGAAGSPSMLTWSPCSSRSLSPAYSPRASTSLKGSWSHDVVYLPTHLERKIKISKGTLSLGLILDADVDNSLNGCIVRNICSKKAIATDGRIQVNDYIVRINSESLRNVTNARAKAILKRTNLIGNECSVTYITSSDARIWKARFGLCDVSNDIVDLNINNMEKSSETFTLLSPRVFPSFYRSTIFDEVQKEKEECNINAEINEFIDKLFVEELLRDVFAELSALASIDGNATETRDFRTNMYPKKNIATSVEFTTDLEKNSGQNIASKNNENYIILSTPLMKKTQAILRETRALELKDLESDTKQHVSYDDEPGPSTLVSLQKSTSIENETLSQRHSQEIFGRNFWSEARTVVLNRQSNETFGISIVGGRVEVSQRGSLPGQSNNTISGIFIKSVVVDSPAGRSGKMFMGDRIISVNEVDMRSATHEFAVRTIKNATNPVTFVLQSLQSFLPYQTSQSATSTPELIRRKRVEIVHACDANDSAYKSINGKQERPESEFNVITDTEQSTQGIQAKLEQKIIPEPESAAALLHDINDIENEDRFCYTKEKIMRKYGYLLGKPILIRLENIPPKGLGFSLANVLNNSFQRRSITTDDNVPPPVIIVDIKSTSPLPLHVGDELLEINGKVLFGLSHIAASEKIRDCCVGDELALIILRRANTNLTNVSENVTTTDKKVKDDELGNLKNPDLKNSTCNISNASQPSPQTTLHSYASERSSAANDFNNNNNEAASPETRKKSRIGVNSPKLQSPSQMERNAIASGVETYIEIDKNGRGLGISIVGGLDTMLGTIVVHEIYKNGAAHHDGRLQPGDQLLEVNNVSLRRITHDQAISLLRRTSAKVRLLVYRDENFHRCLANPRQLYDIYVVELMKKQGRGLGISIIGRMHEPGVYISEIVKGGVAEADGRLMAGDQILEINDRNVQDSLQEDVATILKTTTGRVVLKVGRWKMYDAINHINVPQTQAVNAQPLQQQQNLSQLQSPTDNGNNMIAENGKNVNGKNNNLGEKEAPQSPAPYASPIMASSSTAVVKTIPPLQITVQDENQQEQIVRADLSPVSEEDLKSIAETTASEETHYSHSSTQQRTAVSHHHHHHHSHHYHKPSTSTATGESNPLAANAILRTDLSEEGSEQLLIRLRKDDGNQWGMGIGKRQRGILITSLQPGSTAAEKLAVGDRIMAVNGKEVVDQLSAVTFVRESGNNVALQIGRPIHNRNQ